MKLVPCCGITALLMGIPLSAAESLTYPEYEKQLAVYQKKDRELREEIAQEQTSILKLKEEITATRRRISGIRHNKLEALGIDSSDVVSVRSALVSLRQECAELQGSTDQQLLLDSSKANGLLSRLEQLEKHPAIRLRELSALLSEVRGSVSTLSERVGNAIAAEAATDQNVAVASQEKRRDHFSDGESSYANAESYTVIKSDGEPETLYKIAERVYGNPHRWPLIYKANKDVIDRNFQKSRRNPAMKSYSEASDLIFPGQVLVIPR